ncbi:YbhB YbcL family protein [Desulfovibrio sp. X2]|uniref:YbhB/YbcL family Raf kinase inhibitor-like protein n=1 Tax=Desulfovibrio sp. X2 TaxID=941449 RepID=UPI000358979D|nr:YbhB/YbcL family Raf kinase inhibitor-like protein [Desulfovibrio sp. X2]EPR41427.1 YbhB YbcL family protein [Desulfovibrio sp. X2]
MRITVSRLTVFSALLLLVPLFLAMPGGRAHAARFSLSSPDMKDGGTLPTAQLNDAFGCSGENRSPALSWSAPPAGTKSFVLTMYDPDAPTGSGWWHWVVFDIPASATSLPPGVRPDGAGLPAAAVQSRTDFGAPGYGGGCPPAGDRPHRYVFTLNALDVEHLGLPTDASAAMVGFVLNSHRLGKATLTVTYGR